MMDSRPVSHTAPTGALAGASSGRAVASGPTFARRALTGRLGLPLAAEVLLMGALFLGYRQVRYLTRGDAGEALQNAASVVHFERIIGVFNERTVQQLVLDWEPVVHFLNRYYVGVHFPATIAFILWAFVFHQRSYPAVRALFLLVTAPALVIHVIYPLAPPRLLGQGFVDTLHVYGPNIYPRDVTKSVANQFAAMPSLHFGWALLVALCFMGIKRTRWSAIALLHPAITLLAIVATGNHYWIDAGVAGVLCLIAVMIVRRSPLWPFRTPAAQDAPALEQAASVDVADGPVEVTQPSLVHELVEHGREGVRAAMPAGFCQRRVAASAAHAAGDHRRTDAERDGADDDPRHANTRANRS